MRTVAEYRCVMQLRSDQPIVHDTKKYHTILFRKQLKGNDFQWKWTFSFLTDTGTIVDKSPGTNLHFCAFSYTPEANTTSLAYPLTLPDIQCLKLLPGIVLSGGGGGGGPTTRF